jgi:hypothetical protein
MRKLEESVVQQTAHLSHLTSKHLKGYVPDERQTGIATNKHPIGVDQFIEVYNMGDRIFGIAIKGQRRYCTTKDTPYHNT